MKILIATMPDDVHALFVHFALARLGHHSCLWYTADLPTLQAHSFEMNNKEIVWNVVGSDLELHNETFDVVWYRRPRFPILPDNLHPDDKKAAYRENLALFDTFWNVIAPEAQWINPPKRAKEANCKLLQLKTAAEVGLNIPKTLISNNPEKIKAFLKEHKTDEVIYKPFVPQMWDEEKTMRISYTNTIRLENLPADSMLQITPGIFQRKIPKAFELRITMMGKQAVTAKILSQQHTKNNLDWRSLPPLELPIEKFDLPGGVTKKCIAFMDKLGLVFGCFDFIVTPEGEYYFLEINEQGQFLWVEELDPSIKMLNSFVTFLLSSGKQNCNIQKHDISLTSLEDDVTKLREIRMQQHKNPGY